METAATTAAARFNRTVGECFGAKMIIKDEVGELLKKPYLLENGGEPTVIFDNQTSNITRVCHHVGLDGKCHKPKIPTDYVSNQKRSTKWELVECPWGAVTEDEVNSRAL